MVCFHVIIGCVERNGIFSEPYYEHKHGYLHDSYNDGYQNNYPTCSDEWPAKYSLALFSLCYYSRLIACIFLIVVCKVMLGMAGADI